MSVFNSALDRLGNAQKSSLGAAAYSRYINRPLGRVLAAVGYTIGLSPTQVTLFSGAATFSGIAIIALPKPQWWTAVLATGLLVLGYALDAADGQLARLTGRGTSAGEWLDHFLDCIKLGTIHLAVLFLWVNHYEVRGMSLAVPLIYSATATIFFFGITSTEFLRRIHRLQHPSYTSASEPWRSGRLYGFAVIPTDYGLLCLIFLFLWLPDIFRPVYTFLAAINLAVLVLAAGRWYKSLRKADSNG